MSKYTRICCVKEKYTQRNASTWLISKIIHGFFWTENLYKNILLARVGVLCICSSRKYFLRSLEENSMLTIYFQWKKCSTVKKWNKRKLNPSLEMRQLILQHSNNDLTHTFCSVLQNTDYTQRWADRNLTSMVSVTTMIICLNFLLPWSLQKFKIGGGISNNTFSLEGNRKKPTSNNKETS